MNKKNDETVCDRFNSFLKTQSEYDKTDIEGLWNEFMKEENRQKYLDMHPYKIYYSETEQRWRTELPDPTKKSGRRAIKKKNKMDIDNLIIEYYSNQQRSQLSFHSMYLEWFFDYKTPRSKKKSNLTRINSTYKRCYANSKLANTPVTKIDDVMLEEFLLNQINKYNMDSKAYGNVALIARQVLRYCMKKKIITSNPMELVDIPEGVFRQPDPKDNKTQIYFKPEIEKLTEVILEDFKKNPTKTTGLAILLLHQTGLRVDELLALKPTDIYDEYVDVFGSSGKTVKCLKIERSIVCYTEINKDLTQSKPIYEVVDMVKTPHSKRSIPLTDKAIQYLDMVMQANEKRGIADHEYLFYNRKNELMQRGSVDRAIRTFTNRADIIPKSAHKMRKTFASYLKNEVGLCDEAIQSMTGHSDVRTLQEAYLYDTNTVQYNLEHMNKAL